MARSIYKVARNLARKQLNGKDIRSKIASECKHNSFNKSQMDELIKEYYLILEVKEYFQIEEALLKSR